MKSSLVSHGELAAGRELLIRVYSDFNRRDVDPILAVMHPDVKWPNGMEGGWVHGWEGVREYWARQWAQVDPHVDPVGFEVDEQGRIVVNVHQVVADLAGKVILDRMVQHAYLLSDGLIRGMEIRE